METSEFFRPRFEAAVKVMIQAIMQYARQAGKKQKEKYVVFQRVVGLRWLVIKVYQSKFVILVDMTMIHSLCKVCRIASCTMVFMFMS
jgi:hypothetical protein